MTLSPFHEGERALQARAGVAESLERAGRRFIRDFMPDQHRAMFAALPWVVVGSLDPAGRPWASALAGAPGFLSSPDPRTLRVSALPVPADPLCANLAAGAPLGLLGIELETRRRNRMNGSVAALDAAGFSVRVEQSFGNCKQYIQSRRAALAARAPSAAEPETAALSPRARSMIERADTFFIATAAPGAGAGTGRPADGVDVSHRGGKPGFVRVAQDHAGRAVLTSPDFSGNLMFNTLGNIERNPRAGLLVIDFDTGDLLFLTGRAEILWDGRELEAFAGAERLLRVTVDEGRWLGGGLPLRFSAPAPAPQLAATGSWDEALRRLVPGRGA
jgi:predicted pyridoxine 5'-phosphate oxidase superfamily flavin-nucleotide-binding protein